MISDRMLYEYLHAADTRTRSALDVPLSGSGDPVAAARTHVRLASSHSPARDDPAVARR